MKTARRTVVLAALAIAAPWAMGQNADQQVQPIAPPQPAVRPSQPPAAPPVSAPIMPQFESLAKKGPDGKVIRLEGIVDILAFEKNKLVDEPTRAKIRPAIVSWLADVDQLAIDNLDFIEKIEPGDGSPSVLDKVNVEDHAQLQQMSQMMSQLISAGPLSSHLETKGALTREQSGMNQQIAAEYLQQCMNEIQGEEPKDPELLANPEKAKSWRINNLTRFLYALSCKDPLVSYHRMMSDAAPNIDAIVASLELKGEQASKVNQVIPDVKAAKTRLEQRTAVRKLINNLNFDQRRAFLTKSRDMAPVKDPLAINW